MSDFTDNSPIDAFLPSRIVSGGQTGVDRAGLDVAISLGIDHGGWCPQGRMAEDGIIPDHYQLTENGVRDYPTRTRQNVQDSDATLILFRTKMGAGTLLTMKACQQAKKPFVTVKLLKEIDHAKTKPRDQVTLWEETPDARFPQGPNQSAIKVREWLAQVRPAVLNIAGSRARSNPRIYEDSLAFLLDVFGASEKLSGE